MGTSLTDKELGIIQAVLERYNRQWLPALLDMRAKVDRGETLNDRETALLKEAMAEANGGITFAKTHTEYQTLVKSAIKLYDYIAVKNKENIESA